MQKKQDNSPHTEDNLTESRIQQEIAIFYRNTYCLAHHTPRCLILSVPNEGNPRLSQIGAFPGASDLIVFHRVPGRPMRVLFVEVKRPSKNSKQSSRQIEFQKIIQSMGLAGEMVEYHVVRSVDEFKKIL